jgi:hypothetical protein
MRAILPRLHANDAISVIVGMSIDTIRFRHKRFW